MMVKTILNRMLWIGIVGLSSHAVFAGNPSNTPLVEKLLTTTLARSPAADKPIACTPSALAAGIIAANNADTSAGGGLVIIPRNCNIVISTPATVGTALPDITGNVTVLGDGTTSVISRDTAAPAFRIFNVTNGATLKLRNLVVTSGNTAGFGGGVQTAGTLILKNVFMSYNKAGNGGAIAVLAGGIATTYSSTFYLNSTAGVGGGAAINSGTLDIHHSIFTNNTAPINGGAINTQSNGLTIISDSEFTNNTSGGLGGALSNLGTLTINLSNIQSNTGTSGGGIATGNSNVTLIKSTVINNNPDNCSPLNTISGCVN